MIEFYVCEDELRKALEALEKAKERGFVSSDAIFELKRVGEGDFTTIVDQNNSVFKEQVILKAHPSDSNENWGRVSLQTMKYYRLVDGVIADG